MPNVTFHLTPGYGEQLAESLGYSQAVTIGGRVETSGQGGWDDELNIPESLEDEIVLAFDNLERTLAEAGATWQDVVSIESHHKLEPDDVVIGEQHNGVMVQQFRDRLEDRRPIWTQTGVTVLGLADMRIELRATAILTEQSPFGRPDDAI